MWSLPLGIALAAPLHAQLTEQTSVALGGDMIGPFHSLPNTAAGTSDPGFDAIRALLRSADAGLANQEGAIFDLEGFSGFPAAENGGGYPRQPRSGAEDIRTLGIGLVAKANNHATDWGAHGLLATLASLKGAGVVWAGAGDDPAAACAPGVRERIALVSAATTFTPMSLPVAPVTRQGTTSLAGPGICAIHVRAVRELPAGALAALRTAAGPLAYASPADGEGVRVGDQHFRLAAQAGIAWEMKPEDLPPVISAIRAAQSRAHLVVFALHAHETAGTVDEMPPSDFEPLLLHRANEAPGANDPVPAAFVPRLARQAIDAGADVFMRTGPHLLGGIEIYKRRPIFYSLGSLVFDFGGRRGYTAAAGQSITFPPEWYETVVPIVTKRADRIVEVRLYPATIDPNAGPSGGLPHLATGKPAMRILSRLQLLSRRYGTEIRISDGVGVIRF